jgi:hypothetical protein
MTDTTAPPPRIVLALFGRRRAGKSVLMAALRAVRRPQVNGIRISYVGARPVILRDNTESQDPSERKRIEAAYVEASDALSDGRVPAQTALSDGIMGHRFELTLPTPPAPGASVRLHVDIYDYAGELLAISQEDQEAVKKLHGIMQKADGLLILAETPMKGVDLAAHRESLSGVSALGEALSRLGAEDPSELRQAALLATKWDHQHPFPGARGESEPMPAYLQRLVAEEARHAALFVDWLETDPAAEQHHLLDSRLRALFGTDDYRAFPVSAFGLARFVDIGAVDGSQAEVPATTPLASLNLDEPIMFLVERARARRRRDLLALAEGPAEGIGILPDRAELIALHGEDEDLLALRDDLAARQDQLARERAAATALDARRETRRKIGLGAVCAAALAAGGVFLDATLTLRNEARVQDLVADAKARNQLDVVITARDALLDLATHRPLLPTVRVLGLGYAPQQQQTDLASLGSSECALWASRAQKPDFDLTQARARLETLPGCNALDSTLRNIQVQRWKNEQRAMMDDFARLTRGATCSAPGFVETSVADKRNAILAHLDAAPPDAAEEAGAARAEIGELEAACRQAQTRARENRDRETVLSKLDQGFVREEKWAEYVKQLAIFLNKQGETTEEDLAQRRSEVVRRLVQLPALLDKWSAGFQMDQTFDRGRSDALTALETEVSALPADLKEQKDVLLAKVAKIKETLAVWAACDAFKDVGGIYQDISGNLSARTDEHMKELRDEIARLRAQPALRDHLSGALDQIEGQIGTIKEVRVSRVELTGKFPGANNDPVSMKWRFGQNSGSEPETSSKVLDDGSFTLYFRPGAELPASGNTEIFVSLTDHVPVLSDEYYALNYLVSHDMLLSGRSGLDVTAKIDGTLYQTDGEVTGGTLSTSDNDDKAYVSMTITLTGNAGPTIKPAKCGTSLNRTAQNAPDL